MVQWNAREAGPIKIKLFLVSALALLLVSSCEEKNPSITIIVYPVQYLVGRIGGDDVTVSNITENTVTQRVQIKSSFQDILKDSDALLYIGGLESYMDLHVDDIRDTGVDMADLVTKSAIYEFKRYTSTTIGGITAGTEGPYYGGEEFANLNIYDADPMFRVDPAAMTSMASGIRDYLVQKYLQYKDIFDENYGALELDLARLETDFQTIPDGKINTSSISMTPSLGNWQKPYGIKVHPIALSKYGALPTNDQLVVMKKRTESDHMRYITIEQNLSEDMEKLQQQSIGELALTPVNLNNLSSISSGDKKASKDCLTIMYDNLKAPESIAS